MDFDKLSQKLNSVLNLNTSNIIQWNSKGEAGQVINYLGKSYAITHSFLSNTKLLLTNSGHAIPEQVASDSSRILSERILFERRTNFQRRTPRRFVLFPSTSAVFGVDYSYEYGSGANDLRVAVELFGLNEIHEYSTSVSPATFAAGGIIFVDTDGQISIVAWSENMGGVASADFLRHNDGVESLDVWPVSPDPNSYYFWVPTAMSFCNSIIWMPGGESNSLGSPTPGFPFGGEPTEFWGGFVYDCRNGAVSYALENKTFSITNNETNNEILTFLETHVIETFDSKLLPSEPSVHASSFNYSITRTGGTTNAGGDPVSDSQKFIEYVNCAQVFLADSAKRWVITTEQNGSLTTSFVNTTGTNNAVETATHSSSPYYNSKFYDFSLSPTAQGQVRHTQHNAFPLDEGMRVQSGVNQVDVGQTIVYDYTAANRICLLPVNADSLTSNRIDPSLFNPLIDVPPMTLDGVNLAYLTTVISATINTMEQAEVEKFLNNLPYPCYGLIPTKLSTFRAWAHIKGNITAVDYESLTGTQIGVLSGEFTAGIRLPGVFGFTGGVGLPGVYKYQIKSFTIQITEIFGYSPIATATQPSDVFTGKARIWDKATGSMINSQEGWIFPDTGSICQMIPGPNSGPRYPYYASANYYSENLKKFTISESGYQNSYTWLDGKNGKSYVAFRNNDGGVSPKFHAERDLFVNAAGLYDFPPFNEIKAEERKNHSKIILAIWEFVYNETDSLYEFKFSHYKDYDIFNNSNVASYDTYVSMNQTVNHFTVNDLTP